MSALSIVQQTGHASGTIHPILARLEQIGWVQLRVRQDESRTGPRRRYCELTAEGERGARAAIASFKARGREVE